MRIDQSQPHSPPDNHALERVGWMSMGINVLLILLNALLGWASGSIALAAEALHNLVDMVGSIGVIIGLKLANKRSPHFPYGLYKVENIVALIIAGLVFLAGYEIAKEAIFSTGTSVEVTGLVLLGVIVSLIVPVAFSHYELRIGRQANSPSIIADGEEFRMHALSSGAVLLGLLGQAIGLNLDRWASLFVVGFIFMTGWELTRDAMRALLDASLDKNTMDEVRHILASDPLTVAIQSVTGRNAGRYRFLEAELVLRTKDLEKADRACQRMQKAIQEQIPHVERILIRNAPPSSDQLVCAIPVNGDGTLVEKCFCHASHFFITTVNRSSQQTAPGSVHLNQFSDLEHGKGIQIGKWLVDQKVDVVLTRNDIEGKGLSFVLSDAGVETKITPHENVISALNSL